MDLLAACNLFGCHVPEYKNLGEWSVSHNDLRVLSARKLLFWAVLTNQAEFEQICPDLKLVLLDFNGRAVAERIFSAWQYTDLSKLAANETASVTLTIVAPPGGKKSAVLLLICFNKYVLS